MDDLQCNNDGNKSNSKSDLNSITRGISQVKYALFNTLSGTHNLLVYSDIRVLRATYPDYIKSLLDDNEIVLVLTYYDYPTIFRQILESDSKKNGSHTDIERYLREGSLVIVDSLMTYFNPVQNNQTNNNVSKTNFLSLIRMLLNHGVKNNKKGITIFSDMGSFFHYDNCNQYTNNGNRTIHNIMEFERSIPSRYRDLEITKFCLYHQKDYELHFASKRQKAQLLDSHGRSILVMDGDNNHNDIDNIMQ
jgi:hypothetical protein